MKRIVIKGVSYKLEKLLEAKPKEVKQLTGKTVKQLADEHGIDLKPQEDKKPEPVKRFTPKKDKEEGE